MIIKWLQLLLLITFNGMNANQYNITRHYQGDIYTLLNGTCSKDFCNSNGNQATAIPWAKCQCQCLPSSLVFRQDIEKCVGTISECGEHMAVFVSPAFTESVPLVSLPEKNAMLYPTAEISLTDPSFAAVGSNLCVLTYLKLLGENGWEQVEQLNTQTSPSFKAVGESGKLFLQFTGDSIIRRQLSSGLIMIDVSCERETQSTQSVLQRNIKSEYCIIFRLDMYSNLDSPNIPSRTNDYVIIGLCAGLLGVTYVGAMLIYLLVRRQKRNRLGRKNSEVQCEQTNEEFKTSQFEFVMDSNEQNQKPSQVIEAVNSSNNMTITNDNDINDLLPVRVECVPSSGLQLETKLDNNIDSSKLDFIQLKRRLLFDPKLLDPELLDSPPPAAMEFLTRVREMISVAKGRIKNGKFLPSLNAISEESQMLDEDYYKNGFVNEAFGFQSDDVINNIESEFIFAENSDTEFNIVDNNDAEFGMVENDDRFTFLARIPEDKLLTDSYDGLYDFESFRQEMVKKMQKKRREQMRTVENTTFENSDYSDWNNEWTNDIKLNFSNENSDISFQNNNTARCSRAKILRHIDNDNNVTYDVPNPIENRPVSTYLFGEKDSNNTINNIKLNRKIINIVHNGNESPEPTEDSGYHSGDSESTNNKILSKCAAGLKSLKAILSVNKTMQEPRCIKVDDVQQVTIEQWLSGTESEDQLIIDYDRINCSHVEFSNTDFSTANFRTTLESSINLDEEIDSSTSSDYSDSLEGTPALR